MRVIGSLAALAAAEQADLGPNSQLTKVIELLEGMKEDAIKAGEDEAELFGRFEAYCDEKNKSLTDEIMANVEIVDLESGKLDKALGDQKAQALEAQKQLEKFEKASAAIEDENAKEAARVAVYDKDRADAQAALDGITAAKKTIVESKPAMLIQVDAKTKNYLYMAQALGLKSAEKLFKQEPVAKGEYDFHSEGIIETLEELRTEFDERVTTLDEEDKKASDAHQKLEEELTSQKDAAKEAKDAADEANTDAKKDEGSAREALAEADKVLEVSYSFLEQLTRQCQEKAKVRMQRTNARDVEIGALTKGIQILKGTDKTLTEGADEVDAITVAPSPAVFMQTAVVSADDDEDALFEPMSFLQARKFSGLDARVNKALDTLALKVAKSQYLSAAVAQMRAHPFDKVIGLINDLIDRLLAEQAAEAEKDGFCNSEQGAAKLDRKHRFGDATTAASEIKESNLKIDTLKAEIEALQEAIADGKEELAEATRARSEEQQKNQRTIELCEEAKESLSQAYKLLKETFKGGHGGVGGLNTATVLLQQPVDAVVEGDNAFDASGEEFDTLGSAYTGNQSGADGVLAILEQVIEDNKKELKETTTQEEEAHKEFVKLNRESLMQLKQQETDEKLKTQQKLELISKVDKLAADTQDNIDQMMLAVAKLRDLDAFCNDTGMTAEERDAKRKEEIQALKDALEILKPQP